MKKATFFHLRPLKGCLKPPFFSQHKESAGPQGRAINKEGSLPSALSGSARKSVIKIA
ncbi:hypothetical protein [Halomonas cibimaris]|uniref:hypothetical protein n=1 Tax=Halomonas cibimaris TaxID=657012 RepID=UPI0031E3C5F5